MNFDNMVGANDLSDEDDYDKIRGGKNGNGTLKRRRPSFDEFDNDLPNNDQSRRNSFTIA